MVWYPFVGWSIFWIGLILAIIVFATKRKWYPVAFLISICLYVFVVVYSIDVFNFSRHFILAALVFSALVMIGIGAYMKNKFSDAN